MTFSIRLLVGVVSVHVALGLRLAEDGTLYQDISDPNSFWNDRQDPLKPPAPSGNVWVEDTSKMTDREKIAHDYLAGRALEGPNEYPLSRRKKEGVMGMLSDAAEVIVHSWRHGGWGAKSTTYKSDATDGKGKDLGYYETQHWDRRYHPEDVHVESHEGDEVTAKTTVKMPWGLEDLTSILTFDENNKIAKVDQYVGRVKGFDKYGNKR